MRRRKPVVGFGEENARRRRDQHLQSKKKPMSLPLSFQDTNSSWVPNLIFSQLPHTCNCEEAQERKKQNTRAVPLNDRSRKWRVPFANILRISITHSCLLISIIP